jgi:hypothetical protein
MCGVIGIDAKAKQPAVGRMFWVLQSSLAVGIRLKLEVETVRLSKVEEVIAEDKGFLRIYARHDALVPGGTA